MKGVVTSVRSVGARVGLEVEIKEGVVTSVRSVGARVGLEVEIKEGDSLGWSS